MDKIGGPGFPAIARGSGPAQLDGSFGALIFAIQIIADMHDELRLRRRGAAGDDFKWPLGGIVAILNASAINAAASVADDHNAGWVRLGQRKRLAAGGSGFGSGRNDSFASRPQAGGHGSAQRQPEGRTDPAAAG